MTAIRSKKEVLWVFKSLILCYCPSDRNLREKWRERGVEMDLTRLRVNGKRKDWSWDILKIIVLKE